MKYTQYIKWQDGEVTYTKYNKPFKDIISTMKSDLGYVTLVSTWLEDEFGKELAYFDKHVQLVKGEEKLRKETKEEVLRRINLNVWTKKEDIEAILDSLEKQGYIKFKKEPKEYKVFVKIVTIGGENKKLYYVTNFHLTENIDEAQRFETYEYKDGYAYETVKELV